MAVRTVTVDLNLNATSYLANARRVVSANNDIQRTLNDVAMAAAMASTHTANMARDLGVMSRRARTAERRVHNLREEIDRLIVAQTALAAGGPIPPIPGGARGAASGAGGLGGMIDMVAAVPAPILAVVAAALASAAPAIGSMIGGSILTVLGGGALAIAITSAVQDPKVRAAFGVFGQFLKEEFLTYGHAFEEPMIGAAERFHDAFATMSPKIRSVLAEMSVAVQPLVQGLIGFMEKAGPGIAEGLRGALPVLQAIAEELPALGQSVGNFFEDIGNGSEGAADGMVALLKILEMIGFAVGGQILYWETLFAAIGNLPIAVQGLLGPMAALTGGAGSVIVPIQDAGRVAGEAAGEFDRLTQSLLALTEGFNNQFGAAINYEQALDDLKESLDKNGSSMDITTQKGRDNASALMAAFEAARKQYDANIAAGMSAQQAARQYQAQIEAARQTAIQNGAAADKVNALAAAQRNLPDGKTITNVVRTIYRTEGGPNYLPKPGLHVAYRDGGIAWARDGLMAMGRTSGVASGGRPLVGFAEPGTGGEAFIARNAPAGRSLAIANTAAGWHGGQVVPQGWNGGGVKVLVMPAPTNAHRELADAITKQMRIDVRRESGGDVQAHFGGSGRL